MPSLSRLLASRVCDSTHHCLCSADVVTKLCRPKGGVTLAVDIVATSGGGGEPWRLGCELVLCDSGIVRHTSNGSAERFEHGTTL